MRVALSAARIVFLSVIGVLAACGSSGSSGSSLVGPAGTGETGGPEAGPGVADGSADDGGSPKDAASDSPNVVPGTATPPPGFTQCKSGSFSAVDAKTACGTFQVFAPSRPKNCDGATSAGGEWQVWCNGDKRWVWARFDDVQATSAFDNCAGGQVLAGGSEHAGSGGGDIPAAASGVYFSTKSSATVAFGSPGSKDVTHTLFVTGTADIFACLNPPPSSVPTVVLGVSIDP